MAKATPPEQMEVFVAGVSTKANFVVLGLTSGAVEVERGSHEDLAKVKSGTEVIIEVTAAAKKKLDTGNTVRGKLIGIKVQEQVPAPRGSDGHNS